MNTPEEDQRDQWLSELYEEHAKEAIADFKVERLRSFYLLHPDTAEGPYRALQEGRALLAEHPTASFIFATISIETLLKGALLKPIVYGLVHDEAAARLLIEIAFAGTGISRYAKLLIQILADQSGVDLTAHHRPLVATTLWEETRAILDRRNSVLHRAELVTADEAREAVEGRGVPPGHRSTRDPQEAPHAHT